MHLDLDPTPSPLRLRERRLPWWTGYGVLLAFQAKVFWHYWSGKDLALGDAAHYFSRACQVVEEGRVVVAWSPLYAFFYSLFVRFSRDPVVAALSHRWVILLACSFLVYEIARRLLAPPWGLLVAIWWLVLPVNFDPLYAVHAFAFLCVLSSWLPLALGDSPWHRSSALAALGLTAALVRNELILLAAPFALAIAVTEWRSRRGANGEAAMRSLLLPWFLPLSLAFLIVLSFALRADRPPGAVREGFHARQKLAFGQIYAFVYSKAHREWGKKSPWTDYEPLVRENFGSTDVTLASAFFRNPRAMCEHVATNAYLTVGSLQLSLLGARGIEANPDYSPSDYRPRTSWLCTIGLAGCLLWGVAELSAQRSRRAAPPLPRPWLWLLLLCAVIHGLFVSLLFVPRPAFILPMNLAIMVTIALGAHTACTKLRCSTLLQMAILPALLIGWLAAPQPWLDPGQPRWNQQIVRALAPYRDELRANPGRTIVLASYQPEAVARYASYGKAIPAEGLFDLLRELPGDASLSETLQERDAWLLYADRRALQDRRVVVFVATLGANGWTQAEEGGGPGPSEWRLFVRRDPEKGDSSNSDGELSPVSASP